MRTVLRILLPPLAVWLVAWLGSWLLALAVALPPARAAVPVAGPGETVMVSMQAGVSYLLYQSAPVADAGRNCRFGSPEHTVGALGTGDLSRSEVVYRGIAPTVTIGDRPYHIAARFYNDKDRLIPVSCVGGPVLAEQLPGYTVGARIAQVALRALILASAAAGVWSAWRRRRGHAALAT